MPTGRKTPLIFFLISSVGYRSDFREIIKHCVNATDEDVVIFTGSGATAAIHKLINAIGLRDERAKNTVGPPNSTSLFGDMMTCASRLLNIFYNGERRKHYSNFSSCIVFVTCHTFTVKHQRQSTIPILYQKFTFMELTTFHLN